MEKGEKDILIFQAERTFGVLCKRFLSLLEDLQVEHEIHFNKLKYNLPNEYLNLIDQADYFSNQKYSHLRKKVFDAGGDLRRELVDEINKFNIQIKENGNE